MDKDYYSVLGLPRNATSKQVRTRFLELARVKHPDRFRGSEKAGAEEEFQLITQAFNVLSDPERRRRLDAELMDRKPAERREGSEASRVYMVRGLRAYRRKNMLEAAENFDRATREDPESSKAWFHLARACRHQRRWLSRARAAIDRACELEPMNVAYLKLAGSIFAASGMERRAARFYQKALDWGGEDAEVRDALDSLGSAGARGRGGLFGSGS